MDRALRLVQAARDGLRGADVRVTYQKALTRVAADHFDLASSSEPLPKDLAPHEIRGVMAAKTVLSLSPDDVAEVRMRAQLGDKRAERVYNALVLARLARMRRAADSLVSRALDDRDPDALTIARAIVSSALDKNNPRRNQCMVAACLVRDAIEQRKQSLSSEAEAPAESESGPAPERPAQEGVEAGEAGADPDAKPEASPPASAESARCDARPTACIARERVRGMRGCA